MFITEEPELAKAGEHGTKPVWKLTLKTHEPNGSMGIKAKRTLLSMNFAELLTLRTYLDGSIGTLCVLSAKDPQSPCALPSGGSLVTWLQNNGILN